MKSVGSITEETYQGLIKVRSQLQKKADHVIYFDEVIRHVVDHYFKTHRR